jgi:hypothetical protein
MAGNLDEAVNWAEEHPWATGAIVFGGGLLVLWWLGVFGGTTQSNSGQSNSAAAFYAAEAAQTQAGTQLQLATVQSAAQTAQAQIQASTAAQIAQTQADAQTTLGQQTAGTLVALGQQQALTAQTTAYDAMQTQNTTSYLNYLTAVEGIHANAFADYVNTVVPGELARTNGAFTGSTPYGNVAFNTGINPSLAAAWGFTPQQIAAIWPTG